MAKNITIRLNLDGKPFEATIQNSDELVKKLNRSVGGISAGVAKWGMIVTGFNQGLEVANKILTVSSQAIAPYIKFDEGMRNVNSIIGVSESRLRSMSDTVLDVQEKFGIANEDLTKGLYQAVSAGVDEAHSLEFLSIAAKSSIAGLSSTETAVDGLTTVLNAFHLSAAQTNKVADIMFETVKLGKTTFGELAGSLSQVAPLAASSGIKFEDISAAIATLTKQGVPTSDAVTQIRQAIISLNERLPEGWSNTMSFQDAVKLLNERAGGSPKVLKEMMGRVEGVNAVLSLTGKNATTAADDLNKITNSSGAMSDAFDQQSKAMGFNVKQLTEALNVLLIKVVNEVAPGITNGIKFITGAIDFLSKAFSKTEFQKVTEGAHNQRLEFEKLVIQYEALRNKTEKTKEEQDRYSGVITKLQNMYPGILGNLDLQKAGLDKVKKGFEDVRKEMEANIRVELRKAEATDLIKEQEQLIKDKQALEEKNIARQAELELIKQGKEADKVISRSGTGDYIFTQSMKLKQLVQDDRDNIQKLGTTIDNYQVRINKLIGDAASINSGGGIVDGSGGGVPPGKNPGFTEEDINFFDEGNSEMLKSQDEFATAYDESLANLNQAKADYFQKEMERNQEELDAAQIKNESTQALNDELISIEQQKFDILQQMREKHTTDEVNELQGEYERLKKKEDLAKKEKKDRQDQRIQMIADYALQYDAHQSYLAQLGGVARQQIKIYAAQSVAKQIEWVIELLPFPINAIVAAAAGFAVGALFETVVPQFATGVTNFEGGLAWVGEAGPELVNLPKGSDVIPNRDSIAIAERALQGRRDAAVYMTTQNDNSALLGKLDKLHSAIQNLQLQVDFYTFDEKYNDFKNSQGRVN